MTDKQFSSLRTTFIGATLFIGGILLLGKFDVVIALLVLLVGLVLLLKDQIADWVNWFNEKFPPIDEENEKEDKSK